MSTLSIAVPTAPRGFIAKTGALAAGTALAGAALFGGVPVAPTVAAGLTGSVQRDFVLTADPTAFPTFEASLQNLLNTLGYGDMGKVLGLFGTNADGTPEFTTASTFGALLTSLNPNGESLNDITGNLFGQDISALLANVQMPVGDGTTMSLGEVPLYSLIGGFIGGTGTDESVGAVLTQLGLGPYVGLLDLPFLGLAPTDTVGSLLSEFLGIDGSTTLDNLVIGNGGTLGDATLGDLLNIDGTEDWDKFLGGLTLGGSIMDPGGTGTLGDETLGALLSSIAGGTVDDNTLLTSFLGDLGFFDLLGGGAV